MSVKKFRQPSPPHHSENAGKEKRAPAMSPISKKPRMSLFRSILLIFFISGTNIYLATAMAIMEKILPDMMDTVKKFLIIFL